MLTDAELTAMQTVQETTLSLTATIQKRTLTADGIGGYTQAWTTRATTTGRYAPLRTGSDQVIAEKLGNRTGYMVTLPAGTTVANTDRIAIDGRVFEVLSVQGESWQTATRVVVAEVS